MIYAQSGIFVAKDKKYQGVTELLTDVYSKMSDYFSIPKEINRIEMTSAILPPFTSARARWNTTSRIGEIEFNQNYDKSDDYWADVTVHESGHVWSQYKKANHQYNKDVMLLVC